MCCFILIDFAVNPNLVSASDSNPGVLCVSGYDAYYDLDSNPGSTVNFEHSPILNFDLKQVVDFGLRFVFNFDTTIGHDSDLHEAGAYGITRYDVNRRSDSTHLELFTRYVGQRALREPETQLAGGADGSCKSLDIGIRRTRRATRPPVTHLQNATSVQR